MQSKMIKKAGKKKKRDFLVLHFLSVSCKPHASRQQIYRHEYTQIQGYKVLSFLPFDSYPFTIRMTHETCLDVDSMISLPSMKSERDFLWEKWGTNREHLLSEDFWSSQVQVLMKTNNSDLFRTDF